jgi:hypothetical protein
VITWARMILLSLFFFTICCATCPAPAHEGHAARTADVPARPVVLLGADVRGVG